MQTERRLLEPIHRGPPCTWVPGPGDPPLSDNDPFMDGAPTNDRDVHQKDWWMGFWYDVTWARGPRFR
jgi:hypothetical protein